MGQIIETERARGKTQEEMKILARDRKGWKKWVRENSNSKISTPE